MARSRSGGRSQLQKSCEPAAPHPKTARKTLAVNRGFRCAQAKPWPVQSSLSEKEASESTANKAKAFKDTVDGLSTIGGDDVVVKSVFKAVGLDGIDVDEINLTDDEKINKELSNE